MKLINLAKRNKNSLFLLIWMTLVPFISTTSIGIWAIRNEPLFLSLSLAEWGLFYSVGVITMAFAITSTTFLAFLGGYFLSWYAVPFMAVSYLLAAYLGFFLAKFMDKGKFLETISYLPKAQGFIDGLKADQFSLIVLSRISPVLPFAIINVVLSMINVKIKPFLSAGFIGIMPRIIFFILLGSQASSLKNLMQQQQETSVQLIFFILLALSFAGFYIYFIKYIRSRIF